MSAGISQVQGQGQMVPSSQVITSQAPVQPGGGMVTMSPVLQQQHSAQQQIITQPQAVMINNPTQQATALGMSANPVVQQMPGQQGNQSLWMQQRQQQVLGQQQIIHPTTAQDLQGLAQPGINMPQHGSGAGGMAQQPGAVGPQGKTHITVPFRPFHCGKIHKHSPGAC